jgi:hypothetical protein
MVLVDDGAPFAVMLVLEGIKGRDDTGHGIVSVHVTDMPGRICDGSGGGPVPRGVRRRLRSARRDRSCRQSGPWHRPGCGRSRTPASWMVRSVPPDPLRWPAINPGWLPESLCAHGIASVGGGHEIQIVQNIGGQKGVECFRQGPAEFFGSGAQCVSGVFRRSFSETSVPLKETIALSAQMARKACRP